MMTTNKTTPRFIAICCRKTTEPCYKPIIICKHNKQYLPIVSLLITDLDRDFKKRLTMDPISSQSPDGHPQFEQDEVNSSPVTCLTVRNHIWFKYTFMGRICICSSGQKYAINFGGDNYMTFSQEQFLRGTPTLLL